MRCQSQKIESTIFDAVVAEINVGYDIYSICVDPTREDIVYATAEHGVLEVFVRPDGSKPLNGSLRWGSTLSGESMQSINVPIPYII